MWPIRDSSGDTIGFGARRIFDDDRIEAKYLNTPETPIYKKSQVLYGIDLARREIARASQAVIVEGYTDVMACHLAGVKTAVATCGTAFGDDHARVIRRLLHDHDEFRGEVIFTFDGDEAGQKAALRAFEGDQIFAGQTYVAVEPSGMDPCDLRPEEGDAEVRELVARRVPLYRFVLANVVQRYDLDRADGRIDAMREAAKLVVAHPRPVQGRRVRPRARRHARHRAQRRPAARSAGPRPRAGRRPSPAASVRRPTAARLPDPRDPRLASSARRSSWSSSTPASSAALDRASSTSDDFTHPAYRAVWAVVEAAGGVAAADAQWATRLRARTDRRAAAGPAQRAGRRAAALSQGADAAYVAQHVHRLRELTALRRIADLKSRLQRTNPVEQATEYNRMFGELVALEQHRREPARARAGGRVKLLRRGRGPATPFRARSPRASTACARLRRGDRRHLAGRHPRCARPRRRRRRAIPWEQVEDADWDREESRLRFARDRGVRRAAAVVLLHPARRRAPRLLLQLVRERVTASIVLQRGVPSAASAASR